MVDAVTPGRRVVDALDRSWLVGLLVLVAGTLFALWRVAGLGDVSLFVTAGDRFVDASSVPGDVAVLPGSDGYDGQFYFRLAVDPLTRSRTDHGVTLDHPAYRHQRIVTPLIAWALSGGEAARVPEALVVLNVLALGAVGWTGALLARRFGRHAAWGAAVAGFPGFALTIARDLTECVAAALLLAGLLLLARGRRWHAGVALAGAVLARETVLLAVAPLAMLAVGRARREGPRALLDPAAVVPLAAWLAWQASLTAVWGEVPVLSGPGNLGVPVVAAARGVAGAVSDASGALDRAPNVLLLLDLALVGAVFALAALAWRRSAATLHEKVSLAAALALVSATQPIVWAEEMFLRAMTEPYLLGAVVLLGSPSRRRAPAVLWVGAALWVATAAYRVDVV